MRTETILFIAQFLVLIVLAIYGALTNQSLNTLAYALPLCAVLLTFLSYLYLFARQERLLLEALDRRLPPLEYLETRDEVHNALTDLADQASNFIVATGGHSTHLPYLTSIEQKVLSGRVPYWRVLFDDPVSSAISEHVAKMMSYPNFSLARVSARKYNDVLVTDKGVIFVLPVPGTGGLIGIRILGAETALKLYGYVMLLHKEAQSVTRWPDTQ